VGRGLAFQLAVVTLVVSALSGMGLAKLLRGPSLDEEAPPAKAAAPAAAPKPPLLPAWPPPDLVLVFSAQQHGYLSPCGCSRPQVGGLERRYNFFQMLKDRGWKYAAFDLGDVPQHRGPVSLPNVQGIIKYRYAMSAMKEMGYSAVSFGEFEAGLPLFDALAEYALQFDQPAVIAGNLMDAEASFPTMTHPYKVVDPKTTNGVRVGVTAMVGPLVAGRIKELTRGAQPVRFSVTPPALDDALRAMTKEGVDLPLLLYQGPPYRGLARAPLTEATACAEAYPQFPIVLAVSPEDDPPARPIEVTTKTGSRSWVITVGTKGKFLGMVGVWKTGKPATPYEFRYRRVELTEDFLTPKEKEAGHPIVKLMEEYTQELKTKDYLSRYGAVKHLSQVLPPVPGLEKPGTPADPTYVGSARCAACHKQAFKVWAESKHSHAYETLVRIEKPSNRQFDPECIVCHTVGFGYQGGFVTATPKKTPDGKEFHLKDVGCESCHGPGSLHVANKDNEEWQKRMNPWRLAKDAPDEQKKKMLNTIDQFCQKCHDIDNDVTWIHEGFKRKWPLIAH
jgi:hypothetical protein